MIKARRDVCVDHQADFAPQRPRKVAGNICRRTRRTPTSRKGVIGLSENLGSIPIFISAGTCIAQLQDSADNDSHRERVNGLIHARRKEERGKDK